MNAIKIVSIIVVFLAAAGGGCVPLMRQGKSEEGHGLPGSESFTAGVFLALALFIMLPASIHLFGKLYPDINYPLSAIFATASFLFLLATEQYANSLRKRDEGGKAGISVPVIMTVMIAIPSFFLGASIGVSASMEALFILVAVLAHKASAGFGLALTMVRSPLTRRQTFLLYPVFALSTPLGIFVGSDAAAALSGGSVVMVKAVILAFAAGVFLYMSTVHGLRETPLVKHCSGIKGFSLMLAGLMLTAVVRLILGLAHAG